MNKSDVKSAIILLTFFAIIVIVVIYFGFRDKNKNITEYDQITMLNDSSMFFSVSTNINKLFDYIESNSSNSIINILDSSFVSNNNLNENNVLQYFNDYLNVNYFPVDMYVVSDMQNYIFYSKGYLKNDKYDENSKIVKEAYFILNLDINNSLFSLEVIDKNSYEKLIKSNKFNYKNIVSNNDNLFEYESINNENLAVIYFNDFYNNIINNPKYAYDSIVLETKEKYFSTYDEFLDKIKNSDYFNDLSMNEYNVEDSVYTCKDNKGNIYTFAASGVMNYHVKITFVE